MRGQGITSTLLGLPECFMPNTVGLKPAHVGLRRAWILRKGAIAEADAKAFSRYGLGANRRAISTRDAASPRGSVMASLFDAARAGGHSERDRIVNCSGKINVVR